MRSNKLKVESGKWKVSKIFIFVIILVCLFASFYIIFPKTYHYKDNIYVKVTNIRTKSHNEFDILVAGNKQFVNCSLAGKQYYKDNLFDTKRTIKELQSSCVKINVFGATGNEVLQIKRMLQEDAKNLIIVKE